MSERDAPECHDAEPPFEDEVCKQCGRKLIDHDFGEFLAHVLGVPLTEGRRLQARIVKRIEDAP